MAIASGMPPPVLYLAERQTSINAFPLGLSGRNAVLVVTEGALQRLRRDELPGLVAHEYSLITGGDLPVQALLIGLMLAVVPVAMLCTVFADGKAATDEVELMRTLCAALELPLPPVLSAVPS